uniref:Uncharacterized protein n=1 Tax=Romanomermis culicivorax TaxID=13658 RepID=A0A915I020_ROMCU
MSFVDALINSKLWKNASSYTNLSRPSHLNRPLLLQPEYFLSQILDYPCFGIAPIDIRLYSDDKLLILPSREREEEGNEEKERKSKG